MGIGTPRLLVALGAAVLGVGAAAGVGVVLAQNDAADDGSTRPAPGTYAEAPEAAWSIDGRSLGPDFVNLVAPRVSAIANNYVAFFGAGSKSNIDPD